MMPIWVRRRSFRLAARALVVAGLCLWPAGRAEAAVLHAIIAADSTAPEIGPSMDYNRSALQEMLRLNVPGTMLDVRVVKGGRFDVAAIIRAIQAVPIGPDDAIFFYYSGHGAYAPNTGTFGLPSGDGGQRGLFLTEIRRQVDARRPRFSAIVLDCCNTVRPVPADPSFIAPPAPEQPDGLTPVFDQLFFRGRGSQVIVSSSPGEYAVVLPAVKEVYGLMPQKSLFTAVMIDTLKKAKQGRPSWAEFVADMQKDVDERFGFLCKDGIIPLGTGPVRQARQTLSYRSY